MNAVEIEEAVSALTEKPFDADEFPYAFLAAFGNKDATLRKLRSQKASETTNKSDVGGVLQRNNIHLAVARAGEVTTTLAALRESPASAKHKARFILATDGITVEAEELESGESLACEWVRLADYFGFFLPLAGITTVRQIRENAFDIRATSKLNKLYVELLKTNPTWGSAERRPDMNHFMARLIFSFFAEDTGIMPERGLFSSTVSTMSAADSSNTHDVIGALFQAMNTPREAREAVGLPRWAMAFPYVNGGLFAGTDEVPRFSRTARSYLLQVGSLDWKQINPDIFGSMIQAVADDEERGALGMHYTSVPNILKVLNPLFLDDLRAKLEEAGENPRTLLNLRKRLARIRVFDPACGSGNFLVIAYKEMRKIEHEINLKRGEIERRTDIPLTNFRGIELRDFAAEIARLALIIAEFQCDELYRGQQEAIRDFLPLSAENWITCGNALRIDWLSVCPPTGTVVKLMGDDLFSAPLDQSEIAFENAGGETYICGNPPYAGKGKKSKEQQADMRRVLGSRTKQYGYVDYVGCWFVLGADYCRAVGAKCGLVATNSVCQGRQVIQLWPEVLREGLEIEFAHLSFQWSNSAMRNAGVICVVIGIAPKSIVGTKRIFQNDQARLAQNVNAYLVDGPTLYVESVSSPLSSALPRLLTGSVLNDDGNLVLGPTEARSFRSEWPVASSWLHPLYGSDDFINARVRQCFVIPDAYFGAAIQVPELKSRLERVKLAREASDKPDVRDVLSKNPHEFQFFAPRAARHQIIVPSVSSEQREWFPVGLLPQRPVITNLAFFISDGPLWALALASSKLHLCWLATVCGKLKSDFRYSNTLGWNTFPVPILTDQNLIDLERCAEDILLAREAHYPATIAELYDPDAMPTDLRGAHEHNDEVLERIYVGRRFRNDTERLEKLFAMYTQMTAAEKKSGTKRRSRA